MIRLAATIQPVCKSALKYSTVYPIKGETPICVAGDVQLSVTEDAVTLVMRGVPGGPGNVDGSGVRCKLAFGDFSTVTVADQDASPLAEETVHVYKPESDNCKSEQQKMNDSN